MHEPVWENKVRYPPTSILTTIHTFIFLLLAVACAPAAHPETPSAPRESDNATLSPTGEAAATLTVCLAREPETLSILAGDLTPAAPVFQALYGGGLDVTGYGFLADVLEKDPSLADGDAVIEAVPVALGEPIVDVHGDPAVLEEGTNYLPSGCRDGECAQVFTGGAGTSALMDQMVVSFGLRSGLFWSDGQAVAAGDSVRAYESAQSAPDGPHGELARRTQVYEAVSPSALVWRGLPGYLPKDYASAYFPPLPENVSSAPGSLSYGPYRLDDWLAGDRLVLSRNPNYESPSGDLYFERVEFVFTGADPGQAVGQLLSSACDVLAGDFDLAGQMETLLAAEGREELQLAYAAGTTWEHLDLGIQPVSYDEFYNVSQGDRPAYFNDGRVRQAMAMCIDRQKLVDELVFGKGEVLHSFVPSTNPAYDPQVRQYPHDPPGGIALLEQAGWVLDENGRRVSQGIFGIPDGLEIALEYYTTDSEFHTGLAQMVAQDLGRCGIRVNLVSAPAEQLFAPGPDGPLFGRQFDLAQFAWPFEAQPSCYLYFGDALPGGDLETFPYLWGGWNLTGWQNETYDMACRLAQQALPGEAAYLENHYLTQQIFSGELPVIPLFAPYRVYAARPDLCGWAPQPGGDVLWNLSGFSLAENCP